MPRRVRCEIVTAGPSSTDSRPPLLLVHGVRHAAWCWKPWQERLAKHGWRSAAVSLRGHGRSEGSLRGASLQAYVGDVLAAAETLDSPPVLIGHSLGGILCQRAVHRMAGVRGMALVAPAPAHSGSGFAVLSSLRKPREVLPILLGRPIDFSREDLFSESVADSDAEAMLARLDGESALAQFQIAGPRRAPARAECPVLILGTPDDRVIPAKHVARTGRLQGVPVDWYPGLAHDVMLEPGGDRALEKLEWWLEHEVNGG